MKPSEPTKSQIKNWKFLRARMDEETAYLFDERLGILCSAGPVTDSAVRIALEQVLGKGVQCAS